MGSKKRPSYRDRRRGQQVATRRPLHRDHRFYDPLTQPATVRINEDRAKHWLSVGAQPSDTVRDMLRRAGLVGDDPVRLARAP
jgi:small subunit ribosomal protein S16